MDKDKKYPLFSNGTEFEMWTARNCERCVKAVFFNIEKDFMPKYRCAVQSQIDEAFICDGNGNKRAYDATHSPVCPYIRTERKKTVRRKKTDKNQLELFT